MMLICEKGDDVFLPYMDKQSIARLSQGKYLALSLKVNKSMHALVNS